MTDTVYFYNVYCTTEAAWQTVWDTDTPTVCPNNNAHTIDASSIYISDKVDSNSVTVKEEQVATGGHFDSRTITVNAAANTTSAAEMSFPMKKGISALSVGFVTEEVHRGDTITLFVGKGTTIGALAANVALATAWSAQNYTAGDAVTYNSVTYTCHTDTVSNEIPTNTTYWIQGFRVTASQTVIDNTAEGYILELDDGTNTDSLSRVVEIDTVNNYVYMENGPANTYSAATPTYIKQSVCTLTDFEIGAPWEYVIGESKIGGSHVPRNVIVRLEYTNKHLTDAKTFIGWVEYLY